MNPVVRGDILVSTFLDSVGGYRHKERRDRLLSILDVDLDWRMHQISDGERRRVQLVMGLMAPWDVLLLDEVTVDLDVLVRHELLIFLRKETEERQATILCTPLHDSYPITNRTTDATHIFDGINEFPTHLAHLRSGALVGEPIPWSSIGGSSLYNMALNWLKEDRKYREENDQSTRGPRIGEVSHVPFPVPILTLLQETRDSETFYKKYDYGH
jgi:CCR4-NOT complex subunit CAF16